MLGSVAFGFCAALVWKTINIVPPLLLLIVFAAVFGCLWLYNRRYLTRRATFLREHPLTSSDPTRVALAAAWDNPARPPPLSTVRAALREQSLADAPNALVLCFGDIEVPDTGPYQFEPEVISPTRAMGKQLIWLLPLLLFVVWLALYCSTSLLVPRVTLNRVAIVFSYLLTAGIVTALVWIWRCVIRARYFRLAPGMIQVLEYRFLRNRPLVRSYPVEAGSLFIIARLDISPLDSGIALTLARPAHSDTVRLGNVREGAEVIERLWQALLSTAPTPPLSDEELVG
jgi:hypothetical protein